MSKVVATTVLPEDSGEVLTFGDTGDAIAISGDSLNLNVLQDAGGNNLITSDGAGNLTVPSALGGAMNLLTTNTLTAAASSSFTTLIDSTYDVYCFRFIDINPITDAAEFQFQVDDDAGNNGYNDFNITSSAFQAWHAEDDSNSDFSYQTDMDLAQSTSYQNLTRNPGNDADQSSGGELYLFNPSSTLYVKNFYARTHIGYYTDIAFSIFIGGYINTKTAINAINFKSASGNTNGIIKMYGISKS